MTILSQYFDSNKEQFCKIMSLYLKYVLNNNFVSENDMVSQNKKTLRKRRTFLNNELLDR